eukprot:CAMPEP_0176501518 /NCGR_PEP_ID=MMETSP0200_2-20121128/14200_1 /TAXON_ID=947934 /ORGANISM="Chaetoceros sp., Strain GSL56" /LENGTH=52 /DNA_ID=CAMNT_0017900403 /DNA_START=655 /DNA_END=813 /DNA_ORIENTATION=+
MIQFGKITLVNDEISLQLFDSSPVIIEKMRFHTSSIAPRTNILLSTYLSLSD